MKVGPDHDGSRDDSYEEDIVASFMRIRQCLKEIPRCTHEASRDRRINQIHKDLEIIQRYTESLESSQPDNGNRYESN